MHSIAIPIPGKDDPDPQNPRPFTKGISPTILAGWGVGRGFWRLGEFQAMSLLVVLPFFAGDKDQAIRLAHWIRDLGGVKNHDALLVVDQSTTADGVYEPLAEAFRSVAVTTSKPAGQQGAWGNGTTDATAANEMFIAGATYVYHKSKVPFLWMEPDAAPTRATWLDEIEAEYRASKKPFMGMRVDMPPHELHMSGIGCYPYDVANHSLAMMVPGKTAWDYAGRKDTVGKGKAHFTDLIQHVYRINGNVPEWPTFPTLESLAQINPRAAVFHRCKSDDLIERLRERHFGFRAKLEDMPVELPASVACADIIAQGSNPSEPIDAAYKFVESMVSRADSSAGGAPMWFGWALTDAFLAGVEFHKSSVKTTLFVMADEVDPKPKRTPEQQAAINARMAKARAARGKKKLKRASRKPKLTGVL